MVLINSKGESIHMTQVEINEMLIASEKKVETSAASDNLYNGVLEYDNKKLNLDLEDCLCEVIALEEENKRLNTSIDRYISTDSNSRSMVAELNSDIVDLNAKILDMELSSDKKYKEKYTNTIEELGNTIDNLRGYLKDMEYEDSQNKKILTIIRKNVKASIVRGESVEAYSRGFVNSMNSIDGLKGMLSDLTIMVNDDSITSDKDLGTLLQIIMPEVTKAYNKLIKSVLKSFDTIPGFLNQLSNIEDVYLELDTLSLYLDEIDSDYIEWCNDNGLTYKMDDFSSEV